ncbi:hypothetical protein AB9M92_25880 [Peribacillus frigoritolerans]|uniref:hypothetical protein n=1 Tax=Peribacillus frigoritolerans TaxID=450367 RepID=UPI0035116AC1
MSIKSRLKRIECKLPDESKTVEKLKVGIEGLLFIDYEAFREIYTEWIMAIYIEQYEKADELKKKVDFLIGTLEPIMNPSEFNEEICQKIFVSKIVDWMEDNGFNDLDEDRWEMLSRRLEFFFEGY